MNILLIAGHGDGDCGAVGSGYQEAELTRELVKLINSELSNYANVTVFDTSKNMYKYIKSGKAFNFKEYKYVLEVHFNACVKDTKGDGKTTGTEILVHTSENGVSVENAILMNVCDIGFRNRGVKTRSDLQNMNVCKRVQGVSYALIETCFIDDLDDMKLYQANKEKVAKAIVKGIATGFSLKKVEDNNMSKFTDVPNNHWAYKAINELAELGIVNGYQDGTFKPDKAVTRAELATILDRYFSLKN